MIPRGILQNKSNKNYDILDLEQYENYGKISYLPPRRSRSTTPSRGTRPRSFEMLPFISQIPKSVARTSSMRHSSNDVRFAASKSAGSKPPINPRSTQKGVLRVVSSAQNSPSRIPRRKSVVSSMDGLNRRESSISPDRDFKRAVSMPRRGSYRNISPSTKEGSIKSEFVKSPRRILKPTTLSPILGTPNKDSDPNGIESQPKTEKTENSEKSPSKIPLTILTVARLSTKVNAKNASRDPSPSKSRLGSKSNSRVGSREPSPSKPKVDKIINVKKFDSKKAKTTPITVSRSLTRIASKKPTTNQIEVTKKDQTLKRPSTIKKSVSSTAVDKTKSAGIKKTSSFRNENPEGTKKEAASTKKEPSTLKKEPSTLKKEPSNLKKEPAIKRENSNLKKESGNLKRESSSQKIPSVLSKRKSEENMMKKLEKKNSFKNEKIEEVEKPKEEADEKFEKLIPMTKNNVVSMTTAAITAQPVQITTTLTNQIPLGKTQSSAHLLKGSVEKTDDEGRSSVISDSILEKAQKMETDVHKMVSDAKTVVKDISSDIKKVESDLNKNSVGSDETQKAQNKLPAPIEKRDSFKSVNEKSLKKSDTKVDVNNSKKTPVPTKVNAKDTKENQMVTQPAVEADVSVVEKNKGSSSDTSDVNINPIKSKGNDMVEKVSVSSISVPPDVELESGNKNIGMDRKSMEEKPINDMAESVVEDDR